jgi:hypothetical protein
MARYEGQNVPTTPRVFNVFPGSPDATKTNIAVLDWKLIDEGIERMIHFKNGTTLSLNNKFNPKFKAIYYDQFENDYGRIPSNFVNLSMILNNLTPEGKVLNLCVSPNDPTIFLLCDVDVNGQNDDPASWKW